MTRTIREATSGKNTLRLVEMAKGYAGIVIRGGKVMSRIDGEDAEDVWQRLQNDSGKVGSNFFGYDGAIIRFREFFPSGFQAENYLLQEREYKAEASAGLIRSAPLENVLSGGDYGDAALAAYQATNMLSPFEKMRVKDLLRGPHAQDFLRGAAEFASGNISSGLAAMKRTASTDDAAKWTVATYLPYLWRPDSHMFLKPKVTRDFAERVGHRFAHEYHAALDTAVYESLLDLVSETQRATGDLQPKDHIDVQSFIWVVGAYEESDKT